MGDPCFLISRFLITVMIAVLLKGQTSGSTGQRRVPNSAMLMPTVTLNRQKDRPLNIVWAEPHKHSTEEKGTAWTQTTVKFTGEKNPCDSDLTTRLSNEFLDTNQGDCQADKLDLD